MRPVPPPVPDHAQWVSSLREGHLCQLLFEGGWWDARVMALTDDKFTVKPLFYDLQREVGSDALRPKTEWTWNKTSKKFEAV